MLKLHQQFLRNSLWVVFAGFVITMAVSFFFAKKSQTEASLKSMQNILKAATINTIDINYLQQLAKKTGVRVTYIDKNGTVIYDSLYSAKKMENHINRPEIIKAQQRAFGESIRYSHTLKKELIYVAKALKNGYLRVAVTQKSVFDKALIIVAKVLVFFILLVVMLLYFSSKINAKIAQDAQKIDNALESMLNKDFSIYLGDVECCQEFKQISKKIQKVAKKLKKRRKQKERYTKRLKEVTKRQSDIISAISHEFKNPVAAIVGYAQTIKDTPDLNEKLKDKFINKIESNANKISNMIDTLALSIKLENESIALNRQEFNLADIAKSTKEMLEQKYKGREIILECEEVKVFADRNMLENVFINLVENALKYSEDEVIIKCNKERAEVIDFGVGIDSKDIARIKEKFYRVDGISWNNSIGMGLYIVDYILKLHGLELEIKSDSQKGGSVFAFELGEVRVEG